MRDQICLFPMPPATDSGEARRMGLTFMGEGLKPSMSPLPRQKPDIEFQLYEMLKDYDELIAKDRERVLGFKPAPHLCGCEEMWDDRLGEADLYAPEGRWRGSSTYYEWWCRRCKGRWW